MIVRSKVPLQLGLAGGGTDIPPFKDEEGGCVLSTTINKYVYGTLHKTSRNYLTIHSLDYDMKAKYSVNQMEGRMASSLLWKPSLNGCININ